MFRNITRLVDEIYPSAPTAHGTQRRAIHMLLESEACANYIFSAAETQHSYSLRQVCFPCTRLSERKLKLS